MIRIKFLGVLGILVCLCSCVYPTLIIKEIIGPDSIEVGSVEELVLDCDYEAKGEEDIVVKWFFNGFEEQIYQWITTADHAYASGPLKELIDPNYKVSTDPSTMLRALKFRDVSPALSGNYTCKVSSEDSDVSMTKQLIVYSPASTFGIFLVGSDDEFKGDEVVLCDVTNVLPKPIFNLYVAGLNGSMWLPEILHPNKTEVSDDDGFYNVSIVLPFNSSYLEDGTTKFVCQLIIPGTNYSEAKSVEYLVDNGKIHLQSSLLTVMFLLISLVLAT